METQQELEIELKVGASPKRTDAIDYEKISNIGFKVVWVTSDMLLSI